MPTVLSSEYPIHVEESGDDRRPPLLLINPLGTTIDFWEPLLGYLEERHWVIRFDLRGHGGSSGDALQPYTVADLAGDAVAVLDALDVPRARVFGSSLGGMVAATLAATAPDRVERLILAATSVRLGPELWWDETIRRVSEQGLGAVVDHLDKVFFSEAWQIAVPDRREAARSMLLDTDPSAYIVGSEASRLADLSDVAPQIRASTLLITGEDDPVLRWAPATDLLNLIDDSEAVSVSGAKHRVLLEQPDLLGQVITEFLADPDAK